MKKALKAAKPGGLLKRAARVLMDIHDASEMLPDTALPDKPKPVRKRPRGLCHCQHCTIERQEFSR